MTVELGCNRSTAPHCNPVGHSALKDPCSSALGDEAKPGWRGFLSGHVQLYLRVQFTLDIDSRIIVLRYLYNDKRFNDCQSPMTYTPDQHR